MIVGALSAAAVAAELLVIEAPAHSFQFIGASNDVAMFVEDTSIVPTGNLKTAWAVGINDPGSDVARAYPGTYSMLSHQLDCHKRTDLITHFYVYDANGDVLAEKANPYPASAVVPMSAGELVFNYVCSGATSTDMLKKLHTIQEVKSVGGFG